jgi:hypothetical protein
MPTVSIEQRQKTIERFNVAIADQGLIISKNGILAEWINPEIDFLEKNSDIVSKISEDEKADEQSVRERLKKSQEIMNKHRKIDSTSRELNLNQEQNMKLFEMFIENLSQEVSPNDNSQTQSSASFNNPDEIHELPKELQQISGQNNGFLEGVLKLDKTEAQFFDEITQQNPNNLSETLEDLSPFLGDLENDKFICNLAQETPTSNSLKNTDEIAYQKTTEPAKKPAINRPTKYIVGKFFKARST